MDIQVLSPLSPPIETYNRFQHLEIEDVFEETVLYQDVLPTETASDCRYMSVKVACNDTTRDLGEKIRSATQVNWYDHSLLKRVKRDLRQEDARKLITVHRLTRSVTTVAKTAPTGTSVVELLKTTLIRDKRIKRIFVLWLLQKFNKHDMKCLKCQSGAPATMPHMLACCKIQDVIQSINRRYIKCIEDMLHPRNNRVSSKCYQIACSLIYRMLRQCQGINLDYRPTAFLNPVKSKEITSKVPLNATSNVPLNVTSNVQLNATPNVPLNATSNVSTSDTSIVLVNATSDVSVIDTLNVHINDTLPLGSIEVSDNDTPTSFFKSRSMLLPLSDKTVPRKKGSNYCLHSRTISSIIQMPKTLSLSKRINSKSTKTPSPTRKTFKNPRTKHAAQINGQVSTAATSSVAHYATLALPVPTACSVSAPATSPLAAVTSEVSDEDTQIHAWDTSSVTDEDTLMSNTSTSNYETAEIRQERFRRFKKIADDELAKPNPMVNVEVLNDERLLKYLAGISFNTAENFTSRYLPILKCNSCRNHTLHKYNKIENICQRIRCSVCTTSIPNYFFFPLCYHVHQLLENLDFNVAYAVELDALDCIPDKSLLGPNNIVLERPTKKITEKASHILIMEELKQVKKELDLIKSTTSRIASVSCTDTPTLNDVADTATLSLPNNDSSIMPSIDVAPRPMRNSPWDDIPPAKKQRY